MFKKSFRSQYDIRRRCASSKYSYDAINMRNKIQTHIFWTFFSKNDKKVHRGVKKAIYFWVLILQWFLHPLHPQNQEKSSPIIFFKCSNKFVCRFVCLREDDYFFEQIFLHSKNQQKISKIQKLFPDPHQRISGCSNHRLSKV